MGNGNREYAHVQNSIVAFALSIALRGISVSTLGNLESFISSVFWG